MRLTLILLIGFFSYYFSHAQSTQRKIYGNDTLFTKVEIMDTNINPINARCLDIYSNSDDLSQYINSKFHYPEQCVQMGYDGNMYFEITLDSASKFVAVSDARGLCNKTDEFNQISSILKGIDKFIVTKNYTVFVIKINVEAHYGKMKQVEIINIPIAKKKKRIRRKK